MGDTTEEKFERQLQLEREMQAMGVAKFREELEKARENDMESTTSGAIRVMQESFAPFIEGIKQWKKECVAGKAMWGGREAPAYPLIKDVKDDVLAFLSMRAILDKVSKPNVRLQSITMAIASQIQSEINFMEFKKESPAHYKKVKSDVSRKTRKVKHISTVVRLSAKKDDVDLTQFSNTMRHKIGSTMLSIFIETTGMVELYREPTPPGKRKKNAVEVKATDSLMEWLKSYNARCELLNPVLLPMVIPPRDWTSPTDGGFWSEHIKTPLVRRIPRGALDEMENMDVSEIYTAVNHIQKTAWSVNKPILEIVRRCADNKVPLGNLPAGEDIPIPPVPADIDTNEDARWLWRKQAATVHTDNIRARSKYIGLQKKLQVAERFAEEEEVYFVYNFDFRGRVYPVQVHLNPQGDDVSKALLHFSEGKPVDDESASWLALHGANLFGYDKVSLQERVDWTVENTNKILECAEDPYDNKWWSEADKPWQFLAFCFEWERLNKDPENFLSYIPVAMDGSCNGLQNFSAMLRDPIGGKATNLTPTEQPQDIYRQVADVVQAKVKRDIKDKVKYAAVWDGFITRSLVKRPTMTMPYGATLTGYREQIRESVKELQDKKEPHPNYESVGGYFECMYLAKVIKDSLGEVVVAAEQAMEWLQDVSGVISKENLPIYWVTPVGFPVLQNYRNLLTRRVRTEIAGKFYKASIATGESTKMNSRKMKAAIAPNFVHSIDSAHLVRTVNLAKANDIGSLAMIHDSYGSHAADTPALQELLRHAFVQIHEDNPLEKFYLAMKKQSSEPKSIPLPPTQGSLDLSEVLDAEFFFS